MTLPFLTAQWRNLIVVNYKVPLAVLTPYVPAGTELDSFEGNTFVSLVAFEFAKTKLLGIFPTIPVTTFEEINLRFYVRRNVAGEVRRAVTFIREIAPSTLIAKAARWFYNEPYMTHPTFQESTDYSPDNGGKLTYGIRSKNVCVEMSATTTGSLRQLRPRSVEQFILEHYWGYARQRDGSIVEYRVKHPPWNTWDIGSLQISENFHTFFEQPFAPILRDPPHSAFVAQGSDVAVFKGKRVEV